MACSSKLTWGLVSFSMYGFIDSLFMGRQQTRKIILTCRPDYKVFGEQYICIESVKLKVYMLNNHNHIHVSSIDVKLSPTENFNIS
jgi:hypothetical protein